MAQEPGILDKAATAVSKSLEEVASLLAEENKTDTPASQEIAKTEKDDEKWMEGSRGD